MNHFGISFSQILNLLLTNPFLSQIGLKLTNFFFSYIQKKLADVRPYGLHAWEIAHIRSYNSMTKHRMIDEHAVSLILADDMQREIHPK